MHESETQSASPRRDVGEFRKRLAVLEDKYQEKEAGAFGGQQAVGTTDDDLGENISDT